MRYLTFLLILSFIQISRSEDGNRTGTGWSSLNLPPSISEPFRKNLIKALLEEKQILLTARQSEDGEDGPEEIEPEPAGTFDILTGLFGVVTGLANWNSTRVFQSAVNFFPPDERPAAQTGVDALIMQFPAMPRPPRNQSEPSIPDRLANALVSVLNSNLTASPTQNVTVNSYAPVMIDAVVSAFNESMNDRAVIVRPIMEMLVQGLMQFPSLLFSSLPPRPTPNYGGIIVRRSSTTPPPTRIRPSARPSNPVTPQPSIHMSFPYPGGAPVLSSSTLKTSPLRPVPEELDEADVITAPPLPTERTTLKSTQALIIPSKGNNLPSSASVPFNPYPISASFPNSPSNPSTFPDSPLSAPTLSSTEKFEWQQILTLTLSSTASSTSSPISYPSPSTPSPITLSESCCRTICYRNHCYREDKLTGARYPLPASVKSPPRLTNTRLPISK